MSVKSIEHRLCSAFYDMAWLNLSAGIESLADAGSADDAQGLSKASRERFLENGRRFAAALRDGDTEGTKAVTEELLAERKNLADITEELTRHRENCKLLCNVLQRRIAGEQTVVPVNVDDEVRELLGKLFASEDPMITNLRIRSMVAAFPARITRARFYDRIAGYLSLYNGQEDGEGLDAFCYRLRSAAGIRGEAETASETITAYADEVLKPAQAAVLAETSEDDEELVELLKKRIEQIDEMIGQQESVVRCINPMAALGLLSDMGRDLRTESSVAGDLAEAVTLQLTYADSEPDDAQAYERACERAHAAMEQYFEPLSVLMETETGRLQAEIDRMDDETATAYVPVMKAARLMSTSAFAPLGDEQPSEPATPERVEACRDAIVKELEARFEGQPKAMVREIMASVLAELPVWFESRTEVMEYMLQSLRGCRTDGERRFAIRLLREGL